MKKSIKEFINQKIEKVQTVKVKGGRRRPVVVVGDDVDDAILSIVN